MPEFIISFVDWLLSLWLLGFVIMIGIVALSAIAVGAVLYDAAGASKSIPVSITLVIAMLPAMAATGFAGFWVFSSAYSQIDDRKEEQRQALIEPEAEALEDLIEGHDFVANHEVDLSMGSALDLSLAGVDSQEALSTVYVEEDGLNEGIYAILTDPAAEDFEYLRFIILEDADVYGADNAQEIDRFIFHPDQLDQDEMDVETVLHHGERVKVDEPQSRSCLFLC